MSTVWSRKVGLEGVWWRGVERGGVGGWVEGRKSRVMAE